MTKDEALKMAIKAMENDICLGQNWLLEEAINACKKALEQPAQKPLSDDEIAEMFRVDKNDLTFNILRDQVRMIEQAHGIKMSLRIHNKCHQCLLESYSYNRTCDKCQARRKQHEYQDYMQALKKKNHD